MLVKLIKASSNPFFTPVVKVDPSDSNESIMFCIITSGVFSAVTLKLPALVNDPLTFLLTAAADFTSPENSSSPADSADVPSLSMVELNLPIPPALLGVVLKMSATLPIGPAPDPILDIPDITLLKPLTLSFNSSIILLMP